ncbi:hypothetical protein MC7420_7626 [Coleofasciculus chthonoplastes PCC 7420]|uniref:Uncharacterized protein n=1 Tax=Coleofasciculus chthonoplastes PCC 7420 TaxID=118168 RepID=B4VJJ0_9CYAN|nr:hypothetical protein MC7420_7626 [Coleofasciculus chthonoplastes PCC 7420]
MSTIITTQFIQNILDIATLILLIINQNLCPGTYLRMNGAD